MRYLTTGSDCSARKATFQTEMIPNYLSLQVQSANLEGLSNRENLRLTLKKGHLRET